MKFKKSHSIYFIIYLYIVLYACTTVESSPPVISNNKASYTSTALEPAQNHTTPKFDPNISMKTSPPANYFGRTYQQADGNRFVFGQGDLLSGSPVDILLPSKPTWIVGAPYRNGAIFIAVLDTGNIAAVYASGEGVYAAEIPPYIPAPGMPVEVGSSTTDYWLTTVPTQQQSNLTHPAYLPNSSWRAYITKNGDLEFINSSGKIIATLEVNALPDARILTDEADRLLLFSDPTERYNHGVLGDNLEAGSITMINTSPSPHVGSKISLPENEVIEGIAPIWVDITGDNSREIIVTVSDNNLGSGIVIFSEGGERLVEGPKMGQPFRWRHQIAYGAFGPNGENELAVVRTPHIGGVVEFYQYTDGELTLMAEHSGVTSHTIGSRNLDMSVGGDFDGDGLNELLVLTPGLSGIIAIQRTSAGTQEVWGIPIGGRLSTNLAGVTSPDGNIYFGLGRDDGMLRIWSP